MKLELVFSKLQNRIWFYFWATLAWSTEGYPISDIC